MKILHVLMSCLTLIACNSKDKVTVVSSDETDSLHEHSTIALEKLSLGEWFTARCELLCDEEHGKYLDFKKLEKYGQHTPYDFTQVNKGDSTIISFDVIADCCIDFVGGAQIRNDTLILEYRPPHDSLLYGCDCSCDYRMIYRIDKKDRKWTTLKTDYKARF